VKPKEFDSSSSTKRIAGVSLIVQVHSDQAPLLKIELLDYIPNIAVRFGESLIWNDLFNFVLNLPSPGILHEVLKNDKLLVPLTLRYPLMIFVRLNGPRSS
jgi:hypothetical protein